MQRLLDAGNVLAIVRVLPGFARDLARGETAAVQILVDGTNSNNASIVSGHANRLVAEFALGRAASLTESRVWFNPELKSRFYFIPGVVMNILTIITMMLTAVAYISRNVIVSQAFPPPGAFHAAPPRLV